MLPAPEICERARRSRDPRFDGRFFAGVITTGIYCRPVCPARPASQANVRYFATAAGAEEAGYRPCLRCRPENAAPLPHWPLGSRTVIEGLRLIDAGFLERASSAELALRLGISQRHMNRLFRQALGATPKGLGLVRRRQLAKRLLDGSVLPVSQVAMHAGYGSLRRFNDDIRRTYGRSPGELRRSRPPEASAAGQIRLHLPARQPFDSAWLLEFLERRSLAGLDTVVDGTYRRRIADRHGRPHWVSVTACAAGLTLRAPADPAIDLADLIVRVRRLFDLDADSSVVDGHLALDPLLAGAVSARPGLRVAGAWDGFETAVRAVLGQQVSVARGTALAQRLMACFGGEFPDPETLSREPAVEIGMPGQRAQAVRLLAARVASGDVVLEEGVDSRRLAESLCAIPGIGPWTAAYVAMRVARDPDAFPSGDWVVLKMLQATPAAALRMAARWRPWRAYAVMYLWYRAGERR